MNFKDRYWLKVNVARKKIKVGSRKTLVRDFSKCWEWNASTMQNGYGTFWLDGKTRMVTRVGWLIEHGSMPPRDMQVLHTCDNPPCQNPRHHFLGDHSDNANDKVSKGRGNNPNGSKHWGSKLTEKDVIAIRAGHAGIGVYGENARLGREYGVARETIRRIITREEWHHI